MDSRIFGYLLNKNILFDVNGRKLIQYQVDKPKQPFSFKVIALSETQGRLFSFLLENRKSDLIDKNDIMKNVWDKFSLSSSSQRLWQTVNDLRKTLEHFGLPGEFITNIHGAGYIVDKTKVIPLYSRQS
ncbi:winged helix-turn-helix domain-containing protein [Enterobacter roggenkampii]|uniref:winged helix-turn-helix domain-containing protein n=1 Tax=Enterobacter roggenkampii TaxID=1812935 RepID=UPI002DB8EDE9|nr:helix-turn-helix domain-containing protein [Enterobacter roggenkampii]MEB6622474.1 helix-turn-helix domain-containing protein [Enterobacter roggenkampii]